MFLDIPANEVSRIKALQSLNILDTPPENTFDHLTQLAAELLDCPISLLSFIDENRQWFKSRYGFAAQETSRKISFCAHTICSEHPLIIEDATKDVRFKENPLVTGTPGIRFYAGFLLSTTEGHRLGTLCVIDIIPRTLTHKEFDLISKLNYPQQSWGLIG